MLQIAEYIAQQAHAGAVDKGGHPYIEHPRRVAAQLQSEQEKTVALLHDVLEEQACFNAEVIRILFGADIAQAVDAISRREGEKYMDYIRRAGENPLARRVKLADLRDNMDLTRLSSVGETDEKRLQKYQKALDYLLSLE